MPLVSGAGIAVCYCFLFAVRILNEKADGWRRIYTPAHSVTTPKFSRPFLACELPPARPSGIGYAISE